MFEAVLGAQAQEIELSLYSTSVSGTLCGDGLSFEVKEDLTSVSVDWISLENKENATWLTIEATDEDLEGSQKVYKVEFSVFGQLLGSQSFTLNFVRPYLLPDLEDFNVEYFLGPSPLMLDISSLVSFSSFFASYSPGTLTYLAYLGGDSL